MKCLVWDEEKNRALKEERGVSFEMVLQAMVDGCLLDVLEHPNREKFGGQRLYVVEIDRYAYIVPFENKGEERILKTIFPSRRYTLLYISREEN
ncbi:toxin [bacterium]|nr:toxin [bacterium]